MLIMTTKRLQMKHSTYASSLKDPLLKTLSFKKNRNGKMKQFFKLLAFTGATAASLGAYAGFQVSGTQLLDGNGNPFIMRGVNHAHAWYTGTTQQALADIASVEANTVRVVLSDGQQWTR